MWKYLKAIQQRGQKIERIRCLLTAQAAHQKMSGLCAAETDSHIIIGMFNLFLFPKIRTAFIKSEFKFKFVLLHKHCFCIKQGVVYTVGIRLPHHSCYLHTRRRWPSYLSSCWPSCMSSGLRTTGSLDNSRPNATCHCLSRYQRLCIFGLYGAIQMLLLLLWEQGRCAGHVQLLVDNG